MSRVRFLGINRIISVLRVKLKDITELKIEATLTAEEVIGERCTSSRMRDAHCFSFLRHIVF
jgi:hypothetical protein